MPPKQPKNGLPAASVAVFDLGGVLLDWNPRHLYRKLIPDPEEMEHFLANVTTTPGTTCRTRAATRPKRRAG